MSAALKLAPPPSADRSSKARIKKPVRAEGVIAQIRLASTKRARLAMLIGAVLAGFVPIASYLVAHKELTSAVSWANGAKLALVLGGLAYSAPTVYGWARKAFGGELKAFGFVVLLEGVMMLSHIEALGYAALALLVIINATATACKLVGEDMAEQQ